MAWWNRDPAVNKPLTCDGQETFFGEGEVAYAAGFVWTHSFVAFRSNAGLGQKELAIVVRGNQVKFIGSRDPRSVR